MNEAFLKKYEGLVLKEVQKWIKPNILFDDLYQAGITGLLEAYQSFDESYDTKFSTYALWHIKKRIREEWRNTANVLKTPHKVKYQQITSYFSDFECPHFNIAAKQTISQIQQEIKNSKILNEKEKEILILRLKKYTLSEIGERLSVTRQRIEQIEKIAISKLKKFFNKGNRNVYR